VVLGMLMVVFALDVLQMRGVRAEEVQPAVLAGGVLQELKYGTAALVLFVLGVGALKTAWGQRARAEKPRPAAGLVTAGRSERAGDVPDRKAGAGAPRAV